MHRSEVMVSAMTSPDGRRRGPHARDEEAAPGEHTRSPDAPPAIGNQALTAMVGRQPAERPFRTVMPRSSYGPILARVPISPSATVQDAKTMVSNQIAALYDNQQVMVRHLMGVSDLEDPPSPQARAGEIIKSVLFAAISTIVDKVGAAVVAKIVSNAAARGGDRELAANTAAWITNQLAGGLGPLDTLINGGEAHRSLPHLLFFKAQEDLVISKRVAAQAYFLNRAAQYDRMPRADAVQALEVLRKSYEQVGAVERTTAGHAYRSTLSAFNNMLAELSLGQTAAGSRSSRERSGAELRNGRRGQGVLRLRCHVEPGGGAQIESASVAGINSTLRSQLTGGTIRDLNMNVVADVIDP